MAVLVITTALFATSTGAARAEDAPSSLAAQPSLTDTPDGPKEQLRGAGISPDVSVTQFYQGQPAGDATKDMVLWRQG